MATKRKSDGKEQSRVAKKKSNRVDEDSLQTKAPGAGPSERGSQQSAKVPEPSFESQGLQEGGIGERGGVGAQQTGWSARQQADRMKGRAEEARQGEPQQSGYGGAEQYQHAGSQESPTGPPGAQQSETPAAPKTAQDDTKLPPSDFNSKRSS